MVSSAQCDNTSSVPPLHSNTGSFSVPPLISFQHLCDIRCPANASSIVRASARWRRRCQRQVTILDFSLLNFHEQCACVTCVHSFSCFSSLVMVSSLPAHMSAQILPNLVQKLSDLELLKVRMHSIIVFVMPRPFSASSHLSLDCIL